MQHKAQGKNVTVELYLKNRRTNLSNWPDSRRKLADTILEKSRLQIKVTELYNAARAELSILPDKTGTSFERYQTALDNQLTVQ